jgi:hypothetical protein
VINNYLKLNKQNLIKIFIFFSFIVCWLSISTTFEDLIIQKNLTELSLSEIINFIRHFLIYLIFLPLLIFNINLIINYKQNNFEFNTILFFFIFLYFLSQFPGLIFTKNSLLNISLIFGSLNLIMIFNIGNYYLSNNEKKIFLYISLFFLILIFILFYPSLLKVLLKGKISFYGYFNLNDPIFFNKTSPRSTGISRSILFIILFSDYINISIDSKHKNKISLFIRTFFFYNIFLFQSRTTTFLMLVYLIFIFIFENHASIKDIIKKIFFYLIIPLILVYSSLLINQITLTKKDINLKTITEINIKQLPTRKVNKDNFSSGRVDDWYKLSQKIHLSPIIGYGSQADRFLINQSASNGILYAILSSGIIGLIFYIIFSFMAFLKSISNIINKKVDYKTKLISVGILLILGRSILESSYAVFSIDLIIFCTILNLINCKKTND